MDPALIESVIGCLLHDIGKPVQRAALGYRGKHSAIGRAFMKKVWLRDNRNPSQFGDELDEPDFSAADRNILDAISYHHAQALRAATEHGKLAVDAPAYIAYIADNIAAGTDRRKAASDDEPGASTWDPDSPLHSVFNRFGSGTANLTFAPEMLDDRVPINIPTDRRIEFDKHRYTDIVLKLEAVLAGLDRSEAFLGSLLNVLEATLSFVPSSTDAAEVVDVSLFDHVKLTGAVGSCIWHYLQDSGRIDYRAVLFDAEETFYDVNAFLLATFDISGIQDFIYTIHSDGAAKMLRARSFYLELLTEHLVDELLDRVGLSRANLNYSGGGHAYLLLPNTPTAHQALDAFGREANDWLLENFTNRLFLATGSVALSANDLMRRQNESASQAQERAQRYSGFYRTMSTQLSAKKLTRYSADQLRRLNAGDHDGQKGERECRVCYTVDRTINENRLCSLCQALIAASPQIQATEFMRIGDDAAGGLPLPFGASLSFLTKTEAVKVIDEPETRRLYAKNKFFVGENLGTRLWVGDYFAEKEFSRYVSGSAGIDRLSVLRVDVDNLGQAFTHGFMAQQQGKFNTISRTAAFSRMLSLFFRQHINYVLERPNLRPITGDHPQRPRQATIIYSGGDDLFLVGAWDDVVEFAIELRAIFSAYTQGKLTVSAGIGMFADKYPIAVMAREVGELEDAAKSYTRAGMTKDAVALFDPSFTFDWDELDNEVIGEKYRHIADFFTGNDERGKAFIYKLLALLAERDDRITMARWVYFLTRMRGLTDDTDGFQHFANRLHQWFQNSRDAKQLKVALFLYLYRTREKESE